MERRGKDQLLEWDHPLRANNQTMKEPKIGARRVTKYMALRTLFSRGVKLSKEPPWGVIVSLVIWKEGAIVDRVYEKDPIYMAAEECAN